MAAPIQLGTGGFLTSEDIAQLFEPQWENTDNVVPIASYSAASLYQSASPEAGPKGAHSISDDPNSDFRISDSTSSRSETSSPTIDASTSATSVNDRSPSAEQSRKRPRDDNHDSLAVAVDKKLAYPKDYRRSGKVLSKSPSQQGSPSDGLISDQTSSLPRANFVGDAKPTDHWYYPSALTQTAQSFHSSAVAIRRPQDLHTTISIDSNNSHTVHSYKDSDFTSWRTLPQSHSSSQSNHSEHINGVYPPLLNHQMQLMFLEQLNKKAKMAQEEKGRKVPRLEWSGLEQQNGIYPRIFLAQQQSSVWVSRAANKRDALRGKTQADQFGSKQAQHHDGVFGGFFARKNKPRAMDRRFELQRRLRSERQVGNSVGDESPEPSTPPSLVPFGGSEQRLSEASGTEQNAQNIVRQTDRWTKDEGYYPLAMSLRGQFDGCDSPDEEQQVMEQENPSNKASSTRADADVISSLQENEPPSTTSTFQATEEATRSGVYGGFFASQRQKTGLPVGETSDSGIYPAFFGRQLPQMPRPEWRRPS